MTSLELSAAPGALTSPSTASKRPKTSPLIGGSIPLKGLLKGLLKGKPKNFLCQAFNLLVFIVFDFLMAFVGSTFFS